MEYCDEIKFHVLDILTQTWHSNCQEFVVAITHTHIYIYTKRDVNEMEKIKQNNEIKQVKT